MEKLEVGYATKGEVDFGMMSEDWREGTIKVSKDFWHKYVNARAIFDEMHSELIKLMNSDQHRRSWKPSTGED